MASVELGHPLTPEQIREFSKAYDAGVGRPRHVHITSALPGIAFVVRREGQAGLSQITRVGQGPRPTHI